MFAKFSGDYKKCQNCKEWDWTGSHVCPPSWEAVVVERGDDPENPERSCFGADAEKAALSLAEKNFSNWECPEEMEIWVRQSPDDEWQKFKITVEPVPSFTAENITQANIA